MDPLRILHINPEMSWGGGENQLHYLISALKQRGHFQTLACQPGSLLSTRLAQEGTPIETLRMRNELSVSGITNLRRIFRKGQFDVVHFHTARAHMLGAMATWSPVPPVRIATRRMEHRTGGPLKALILYNRLTDTTVAISQAVRHSLLHAGTQHHKVRIIPDGVDTSLFENKDPHPWRHRLGIDEKAPVIGFIGSLIRKKGIETLLRAGPAILKKYPSCRLLVVGEGPLQSHLEQLITNLGITGSVIFTGRQTDIPGVLAAMDVFVLPSLQEGLGVAALEAMAAEQPIVASRVGGLPESVVHGETGFLVKPEDADELAGSLLRLLEDPELCARFGRAGKKRVATYFTCDQMALQYEALYCELLCEKKRSNKA